MRPDLRKIVLTHMDSFEIFGKNSYEKKLKKFIFFTCAQQIASLKGDLEAIVSSY